MHVLPDIAASVCSSPSVDRVQYDVGSTDVFPVSLQSGHSAVLHTSLLGIHCHPAYTNIHVSGVMRLCISITHAVATCGCCCTFGTDSAHWMRFVLVVVIHVLIQVGFCPEYFVTEAALPLNTMVSVPGCVLDVIPAS